MFKAKSRFALLSAIVIIMAMGVMLVGNTFANNVSRNDARIELQNGGYNVILKYSKTKGDTDDYVQIDADHRAFDESSLWCPGRTEIVYLEVVNQEKFPVEFSLSLKKSDVQNQKSFDNTLTFAAIDGDLKNAANHPTNWSSFRNAAGANTGVLTTDVHELLYRVPLNTTGANHKIALAIHMDESADSRYQNAMMNLQFVLTVDANYKPYADPSNENAEIIK